MGPTKTRQDWTSAALGVIASVGVERLSVERLATELGVTKGSFYWHFSDRAALIESALLWWEEQGTDRVIAELEGIADPAARLRLLLLTAFGDLEHGPVDVALAARGGDALIGPIIQRVMAKRVDFVTEIFAELGSTPAQARRRGRIAVATYIGHFQLRVALPNDRYLAKPAKPYIDELMEIIAVPST